MSDPPDASGRWEKYVREDGYVLWLKTSTNSTGYENVIKQLKRSTKPYSAKFRPDPTKKAQQHLPGSSSDTAQEAAIKYAEYLEKRVELAPPRKQMATWGGACDHCSCTPAHDDDVCGRARQAKALHAAHLKKKLAELPEILGPDGKPTRPR